MAVYPVIMCGGSGTRLWPASRPGRPKQFIPLVGERSTFQETVLRVAPLGPVIVVAGIGHQGSIEAQLKSIGETATLVLEPQARDSAPAMAAAAAFIASDDPNGIAVFVSADHHIADAHAFRAACEAAIAEARKGRIVTLGVRPTRPETAYGYIAPASDARISAVKAFVEKPDAETAAAYVAKGYLWNSGNFIAGASTLLAELDAFAPDIAQAAREAIAQGSLTNGALRLGPAFAGAPKISIDYAVMEKTTKACVMPVAFPWADIGAWDAVQAASPRDAEGNAGRGMFVDSTDNLVRSSDRVTVALVGMRNTAVIIEDGAVLVADLSHAQSVKAVGERMKEAPLMRPAPFADLDGARIAFDRWIRTSALPLWWSLGADHVNGGFRETLDLTGAEAPRRGRVQPRQVFAFAVAGEAGWLGPWRAATEHGLAFMEKAHRRPDGLLRTLVSPHGAALDETTRLYDHAFALLALAALGREAEALDLFARLESMRHPAGGWRETDTLAFQSNPHMHLFEAMLAWEIAGQSPAWAAAADEVAQLCLSRFIDGEGGFLREYFNEAWEPAAGDAGRMIEPGHQFEWAWLLEQWGVLRERDDARAAARRLYAAGRRGVDASRGVAVNGLWDDFSVRNGAARLWVQAEHLKAALLFGEDADALSAAVAVHGYLDDPVPGAWRDTMDESGAYAQGPSPASTLYHLITAWRQLR